VVLDPKSVDPMAYRGVDWITPNEQEARRLLGDDRLPLEAGQLRRIVSETQAGVVLTRGERLPHAPVASTIKRLPKSTT
jgi:bifunctional ADP-heptose synthase (sugar kinase/adenylyltransferase)